MVTCHVVLPFLPSVPLSYALPARLLEGREVTELRGYRIVVPLRRALVTGVLWGVAEDKAKASVREVYALPDLSPCLTLGQLALCDWMADYYLATPGQLLRHMLGGLDFLAPPLLAWTGKAFPMASPAVRHLRDYFREGQTLTYPQALRFLRGTRGGAVLHALIVQDVLALRLPALGGPRVPHMRWDASLVANDEGQASALVAVGRARQQVHALHAYRTLAVACEDEGWVPRQAVVAQGATLPALRALCKRGILEMACRPSLFVATLPALPAGPALEGGAVKLLKQVEVKVGQHLVTLLHSCSGVVDEVTYAWCHTLLAEGKQVLYLLPSYYQLRRCLPVLVHAFGDRLLPYYQGTTPKGKRQAWRALIQGTSCMVVGHQGALLLPFTNLGGVVILEEGHRGYRQEMRTPHYHLRDSAVVLAQQRGAKVLMTSKAPSLGSYYHATTGKYGYVRDATKLASPLTLVSFPVRSSQTPGYPALAPALVARLQETYRAGGRSVVLASRKGYALLTYCRACGWQARCKQCAMPMAYHQEDVLACPYCKRMHRPYRHCPACQEAMLHHRGVGIEQFAYLLKHHLPEARLATLTGPYKASHAAMLGAFAEGKVDVLLATYAWVDAVATLPAETFALLGIESILMAPRLHASLAAYQVLTTLAQQLSKGEASAYLVQVHHLQHPLLQELVRAVNRNDPTYCYASWLADSKAHHYPPYGHLVRLAFTHANRVWLQQQLATLCRAVPAYLRPYLLGPHGVPHPRALAQEVLWVKLPATLPLKAAKRALHEVLGTWLLGVGKGIACTVTVDAV